MNEHEDGFGVFIGIFHVLLFETAAGLVITVIVLLAMRHGS